MIERVRDAIMGPCLGDPEAMARAAIEAMREPTDEMREVGKTIIMTGRWAEIGNAYRAMIDEALITKSIDNPKERCAK